MPGVVLRDRGVYRLPDGREVVATECAGGEYCIFAKETWDRFGLGEFLLNREGKILKGGEPTGWRAEDLTDTERAARL